MNPVLNIIGNMFGNNGGVGSAQANSTGNNPQKLNEILGLFNAAKNSSDPMGMFKSMSKSNPLVQKAFNCVDKYGGDMKKAFFALSEEYGVDPQNIIGMIK